MRKMDYNYCIRYLFLLTIFGSTKTQDDMGILLTVETQNNNNLLTIIGEPNATYTADNLGFVRLGDPAKFFRSCDVDYKRKRIFLYDSNDNSIIIGLNFTTDFNRVGNSSAMSFKYIHYGVSRDYTRLAYDWLANNLYWTDPAHRLIGVQAVREDDSYNSFYKVIVSDGLEMPTGIAVDPINRLLFWVDALIPKIERSDLSGSETSRKLLVTRALSWPVGLTADLSEQRLYWTDYTRDSIETVSYTGEHRQFLRRRLTSQLYDIAVYKNLILTTDVENRRLWYMDKDPTVPARRISLTPLEAMYGVTVYHPDLQPDGPDNCAGAPCSDICVNDDVVAAGYTCLCREEFKLDTDGSTCIADETKLHRSIIFSNATNICRLDVRALSVHAYEEECFYHQVNATVTPGLTNEIRFLDFDTKTRHIFLATDSKVEKLSMDGQQAEPENLFQIDNFITGLSYDWVDHVLYSSSSGTNASPGKIMAVNVDSGILSDEKTNLIHPLHVLVVPLERKLFWLSKNTTGSGTNYTIESSLIGNETVITIVTSDLLVEPKDLSYDSKRERLFWYDNNSILSCKYDGSDVQTFYHTPLPGYLLTVYKDYLMWLIDGGTFTVMIAEHIIQPIQMHQKFFSAVGVITDFKVMDEDMQPITMDPCHDVNNPCQHLCLSTKAGAVCHCEYGYQTTDNGHTCTSAFVDKNFALLSDWTHNRMYQIDLTTGAVHAVATRVTERATSIIYSNNTQKIIWFSNWRKEIIEVNIDGTEEKILGKNDDIYIEKIVQDDTSGNIFYAAVHLDFVSANNVSYIGVMNPDGLHTKVIESLHYPGGLAIDAVDGFLFYSELGESGPRIGKSMMDGSQHNKFLVTAFLYNPTGFALDYKAQRLYWADSVFDEIISVDYYGGDRTVVVQDPNAFIVDIQIDADFIYYIGWNRPHVTRVPKTNFTDATAIAPTAEFGRLETFFVFSSGYLQPPVNRECEPNNGKRDCSVFCLPSAGFTSVCACQDGYTLQSDGKTCDNGVDDCLGVTCLNNGTCLDKIDNFTCQCIPGFTGQFCEVNIDECLAVTCFNGGSCMDEINAFRCQCVPGYNGTLCETNINECAGVTCENGGTCQDGINEYTCICSVGYEGQHCLTEINECVNVTCQNGGTCQDGVNQYTCQCVAGFRGIHCEEDINECVGVTCENGGTCDDVINDYNCICVVGYTGRHCQSNIDDCVNVTCQNGGTCQDSVNQYTCQCVAGYTGQHCQTNIDECLNVTCQHGGTCQDDVNQYTCQCVLGYTGDTCEIDIDDCVSVTCQHGGTCHDGVNQYTCQCVSGYTAQHCETNIDECVGVTCQHGGSCLDGVNQYTCQCVAGYTGSLCETDIDECLNVTCQNGGTCQDGVNQYTCQCVSGFSGQHCQINIDDCQGVTCQHGGICEDGVNQYTCRCTPGYNGTHCEIDIDNCVGHACLNGATCNDGVNEYTCTCIRGFIGQYCEINRNDCVGIRCRHNGTCEDEVDGYTCHCVTGYTGRLCQLNVDDCTGVVCQNQGTCLDGVNSYTCNCLRDFTGTHCEQRITTTSATSGSTESAGQEGTSVAPIVGGSIAALVLLAIVVAVLVVIIRRRSAVPRHERLHSKHNRNDSMKERDKRVSDKPDPEKHRSRPSDVDLHKERSGSLRQSRPVSDNEIAYLGMTNPVYDIYGDEASTNYAPSMTSYAASYTPSHVPSHYSSYAPTVIGSHAPSYIGSYAPSRSGSRPPSVAYSDGYVSIHSSQMGPYDIRDGDRRERRHSSKRRK